MGHTIARFERLVRRGEAVIFNMVAVDTVDSKWRNVMHDVRKIWGSDIDPMVPPGPGPGPGGLPVHANKVLSVGSTSYQICKGGTLAEPNPNGLGRGTRESPFGGALDVERTFERLDLPASRVGFHFLPPCRVELKFFQAGGRWSAYLLCPPENIQGVADWANGFNPAMVHVAGGISPRVVRVEFDVLPEKLAHMLGTIGVSNISLHPEGVASVLLHDVPDTVVVFIQTVTEERDDPHEVRVRASKRDSLVNAVQVTSRQKEAISLAVAMGYYDVPHRVGLRELASQMKMSLGALSALLRRGEAAVLKGYADRAVETEWDSVERQIEGFGKPRPKTKTPVDRQLG